MMMVRVMRRRKSGRGEQEHAGEEEELLHGYQNVTIGCRLSLEF
jgi:hypothetical protein